MNVIYQSKHFSPEKVVSTYARLYSNGEVSFADVDRKHKTIRQWWVNRSELNADVAAKLRWNEQVLTSGLTMQEREQKA